MVLKLPFCGNYQVVYSNVLSILQLSLVLSQTFASPVWMPQFLSGGTGRNIRHLPCVSRRNGETGTCMFAYTCMKANGTHLGTCIDRFYFGSCCKLPGEGETDLENELNLPVVVNNQVTGSNDVDSEVSKIVTTDKTTTEKLFVPIISPSQKLNKTQVSAKPTVASSTTPSTTTQQYFLSTFQVVHDNSVLSTTLAPTTKPSTIWTAINQTTTVKKPVSEATTSKRTTPQSVKPTTPKIPVTTKVTTTTTKRPSKPTKPTTKKPPTKKPTPKPTTKPPAKPIPPTTKPTTPKPIKTTQPTRVTTTTTNKPSLAHVSGIPTTSVPTTTTTKRPSTVVYKPISSITNKPSTTTTTKITTTTTTTASPISTTSELIFSLPGSVSPNASDFHTFRPDLSQSTNKPELITGPGLTTFSYVSEKESTTSAPITSESSTLKEVGVPTPSIPTAGITTEQQTTVQFFPETIKPESTKIPWVEIMQELSSDAATTSPSPTTTESPSPDSTTGFTPSFGSVNISDYTDVCGRRLYPEARIVGGEKATFGKWPWQISLRQWRTSTYLHKCGAALLNENWAITAAHCVENVPPSDLLLRLGEHDLSTEEEPFGYQERRVQIVASHPQFDPRTFEYDLALLRFYEPVKFQPNIIPVCVPDDSTNFVGQTAHVTGWGRLYEDGPLPSVLQEVSVPVINNTLCENMYRAAGYIEHIPDIFICAGWKKGGFDSCEGDSGGPMVIQRADKRWLLAGVISWGIGCAEPNQPGVYTRISEFRHWINQILQF